MKLNTNLAGGNVHGSRNRRKGSKDVLRLEVDRRLVKSELEARDDRM